MSDESYSLPRAYERAGRVTTECAVKRRVVDQIIKGKNETDTIARNQRIDSGLRSDRESDQGIIQEGDLSPALEGDES
jgi:hypothetical protein